jgi:hypothetical protein
MTCATFLSALFSYLKKINAFIQEEHRGLKEKIIFYLHNYFIFHNLSLLFASVKFALFGCTLECVKRALKRFKALFAPHFNVHVP